MLSMNRPSSEWFRLALLLLTTSSVFSQRTDLTPRADEELVVCRNPGNVSTGDSNPSNCVDELGETLAPRINALVFDVDQFEFQRTLLVRRNLTITSGLPSSTKAQLSCRGTNKIFKIERRSSENVTVELRSLRITSCTTAGLDGVIHVGSGVHVVFSNVELVNNGAEGINHSLVVVDSSARLEVTGNSLFSSNHGRVMLVGGGSEVILDNSTFSDNTGNTNGTVLATKPGSGIQLNITGSLFQGNVANESNGGVMWLESSIIVLKDGTRFTSNVAGHHGGSLFLSDNRGLNITDTLFQNNSCHFGKGGAVFIEPFDDSDTRIRRSIFKNNSANGVMGMGGALAFGNTDINSTRRLELGSDVLFLKNTARVSGGAVIVYETRALVHALSAFINNSAQGAAGGLHFLSSKTDIIEDGYINAAVSDASFVSNGAPTRGGGAVFLYGVVSMNMSNSTCSMNSGASGGAVHVHNARRVIFNEDCRFENNSATKKGGSFYMENSSGNVTDCNFIDNEGERGGSISIKDGDTFHIRKCTFERNHASHGGGAIDIENLEILRGHDTKVTLKEVIFRNNWSSEQGSHKGVGGAVRLTGAGIDADVEHCLFENNIAHWGGCVYLDEAFSTTFENTNFSKNTASLGGALYIVPLERELHGTYDSTNLSSCLFKENTAARGGAIFARPARLSSWELSEVSNSSLRIEDSTFLQNRANDTGGGLFLALMNAFIDGVSFRSNSANRNHRETARNLQVALTFSDGGAVYASDGSYLTLSDTNFTSNSASGKGGAVCIDDALFNCTRSCTFQTNDGRNGGGVFCALSSEKYESNQPSLLHCDDCVFERNNAQKGGGIYASFPRTNPDAQQFHACQGSSSSDRSTTGTSSAANGDDYLVLFNPQRMQDNSANETGSAVFSTQPCAIMVSFGTGNMNLVQYFNTITNEERTNYTFASPARTVRKNDSSLKNMNRGNTSEEMSQLEIKVFDYFGQRVESSRIVVELRACQNGQNCCGNSGQTDGSFIFDGEEKRVIDHGMVNFANLSISNGLGGSPVQRLWVCFENEGEEQADVDPVSIDVSFRECYKMELNDSTTGGCRECPTEQYLDNKSNSCKPCPSQATCPGLTIIPEGGFWHATSVSHRLYKCHPREACDKDEEQKREQAVTRAHERNVTLNWTDPKYDQCNSGYEGILCGSCKEDHGRWNDVCRECLGIPLMWIALLVSLGWNLLVLLLFIYSARSIIERLEYNRQATSQHQSARSPSPSRARRIQQIQMVPRMPDSFLLSAGPSQESQPVSAEIRTMTEETQNLTGSRRRIHRQRIFRETIACEPLPLTNPLSEALKIILNFMQVVYLASLLSENLPSIFRWSVIPFDALNLTEPIFLIADCLLKGIADRAIIRMTLQSLFPVFLFLFICLIPAVLLLCKRRINFGLKEVKLVALCTVYLYFVPEVRILLKSLDGVRVEDEYADLGACLFWSVDTAVKFLQGSHAFVFGFIVVPFLVALLIGFPLSLLVSLKKNKDRMQEDDVVSSYGFLYKGYEFKYYYWEIVIVIRKIVIAVLSVFVQNAELQSIFISFTLVFFLSLQLIVSPFSSDFPGLNILESLSLSVSTVVFFSVSSMLRSHELGKRHLLYAIAWITMLVLFSTVLAMALGLFAAAQGFLNDKLIEKGIYSDKQSVEVVPITTKMFKLLKFYFGKFYFCFEAEADPQHLVSDASEV